jgi:DNA-binding CsgD family transcriptional regulator
MFISAPDGLPSQLQIVVEGFVDGILILTEFGEWMHANASARHICQQLTPQTAQPTGVPKEIWQVCWSLIESRLVLPESTVVLESEVITKTGRNVRIRARWLDFAAEERAYLLVVLEDRHQTVQHLATSDAKKYDLTDRQAQVWALRRAGYSYQAIADQLYITLNTVKKHMKDIRAKILEIQQWQAETACDRKFG